MRPVAMAVVVLALELASSMPLTATVYKLISLAGVDSVHSTVIEFEVMLVCVINGAAGLTGVGSGVPRSVTVTSGLGGRHQLTPGICLNMKRIGAACFYSYRPGVAGDIAHVEAESGGVVDNVVSQTPACSVRRGVPSE